MAMGGSTNTVLHTLALAREAGVDYPIARLNEVAERVPNICKVSPSSSYHIEDVERAGGVSAILWELFKRPGILHGDAMTVTGKTLYENVQGAESQDQAVIRPLSNPYSERGGLAILSAISRRKAARSRPRHPAGDDAPSRAGRGLRLARRGQFRHPQRKSEGR